MKALKDRPKKELKINFEALDAIGKKQALINEYIEAGQEIPKELSKNFVSHPLSDDPYSSIK